MSLENFIPRELNDLYEFHNYRNAAQILSTAAPNEYSELNSALATFRITVADIVKPGGNESDIPKKISNLLRRSGWLETRIKGDLIITKTSHAPSKNKQTDDEEEEPEGESETIEKIDELKKEGGIVEEIKVENFLDGHKVDYIKNRVAFDLEWNSKDQTFDRDLYAFRAFYECGLIDAAVLMTRSESLNEVFEKLGPIRDEQGMPVLKKNQKPRLVKEKYGASTTWMGKLLYRMKAGRHGGCPVLVIGITPRIIEDWTG